jgi:recombination protein RecR
MDDRVQEVPGSAPQGQAGPRASTRDKRSRPTSARTPVYPESVDRLIAELGRLPGIGRRTAERLAFHILKSENGLAAALSSAITDVKQRVRHCSHCYNLTDADPCPICADPSRDHGLVLVVEQPKDLIALEQTGMHKGVYHVLLGRLSPLEGVGPDALTIPDLLKRVGPSDDQGTAGGTKVREVILGLNPTLEGDGTAMYLAEQLRPLGIRVSRLARGLPTGWQLEYANKAVLTDAIQGRQEME